MKVVWAPLPDGNYIRSLVITEEELMAFMDEKYQSVYNYGLANKNIVKVAELVDGFTELEKMMVLALAAEQDHPELTVPYVKYILERE